MTWIAGLTTPLRILLAAAVVAVLLVAAGIVFASLPGRTGASAHHSPTRTPTAASGMPAPSGSYAPAAPAAIGPRTSTEVQSGTGAVALPAPSQPPAAFAGTPPASGSRTGGLVTGFPADIAVPPGTRVTRSSITTSGYRTQAEYTATSSERPADLLSAFSTGFAAIGLVGSPTPTRGGASAMTFTRGTDSITVTVSASSSGSRVALFAALDYSS